MKIRSLVPAARPLLILAPMQDVTDLAFWKVIHLYGGPDLYYTEYFRTHRDSKPERHILKSIDENPTSKPVIAQMIGEDIPSLVRTAKSLQTHNVIGIDLNLGCPAPIVCKKSAGGGLLKTPGKIDEILTALREAVTINLTVKTRLGFDSVYEFERLLEVFQKHSLDALTIHGRTVKQLYRGEISLHPISTAASTLRCPVFANGNIINAEKAQATAVNTGAHGLMIGRGAIRNPWIFRQVQQLYEGSSIQTIPTLMDLRNYIERLYFETLIPDKSENLHVSKMKKYMNFIAPGVGGNDNFLGEIRRSTTGSEFFGICDKYLQNDKLFDYSFISPGNPIVSRCD